MIRTNGLIASLLMHAYISRPGSVHYSTMVTNAFKIDGPFKVFLTSYAAPLESVHDPTSAGKNPRLSQGLLLLQSCLRICPEKKLFKGGNPVIYLHLEMVFTTHLHMVILGIVSWVYHII